MHLLLTDLLTCPRCGPEFGLILLSERTVDRRVLEGHLGCPNCRDRYPVQGGFADLRAPPRSPPAQPVARRRPAGDETRRLAALLGMTGGPGTAVLVGPPAFHAPGLARLVEGVEWVAVHPGLGSWPEAAGVSRLMARPGLPFFSRTLRAAATSWASGPELVREVARVVARLGRVVVLEAVPEAGRLLEAEGLGILAEEPGTVVAARG